MDLVNVFIIIAVAVNFSLLTLLIVRGELEYFETYFIVAASTITLWCISMLFYRMSNDANSATTWARFLYFFPLYIPLSIGFFAKTYREDSSYSRDFVLSLILTSLIGAITLQSDLIVESVITMTTGEHHIDFGRLYLWLYVPYFLLVFSLTYVAFIKKIQSFSQRIMNQFTIIFIGLLISSSVAMITNLLLPTFGYFALNWVGQVMTIIWVIAVLYAVVVHHFFDLSRLLIKSISISVMVIIFVLILILSFWIYANSLLGITISVDQLILTAIVSLLFAFLFNRVGVFIEQLTSIVLFKQSYKFQDVVKQVSKHVVETIDLDSLLNGFYQVLATALKPQYISFWIFSDKHSLVNSFPSNSSKNEREILSIVNTLKNRKVHHVVLSSNVEDALGNKMLHVNLKLVIPLIHRKELLGYMLVGQKVSGNSFSTTDINLLTISAEQLSIAINNALAYEEIKAFNLTLKEGVERATAKLKAANARLKELDTLKDEFVSIASHELRTPLTSIRNYQWMLLNGKGGELAEKQRYYIERAYRATNRLTKLVTDMLNVSRIDSGRVLLAPEQCDLFDMTNEIIEELAVKSKERTISVEHQRPKHRLPPVVIDRDKIYEVITNLLSNAIKYTQIGGAITISYVHSKEMVTFVIEDNGMGIEPKYLDALFTKFGFVKNSVRSNHPNTESTGLGLYICKAIVELHGGTIWAKSAGKDQGSTFAFTIPVYTERLYAKMTREYNKEKDAGLLHNSVD